MRKIELSFGFGGQSKPHESNLVLVVNGIGDLTKAVSVGLELPLHGGAVRSECWVFHIAPPTNLRSAATDQANRLLRATSSIEMLEKSSLVSLAIWRSFVRFFI